MTDALRQPHADLETELDGAAVLTQRLQVMLELEFETLKSRDLTQFDELQTEKNEVLAKLDTLAKMAAGQSPVPRAWEALKPTLLSCREAHLRNIQLLQRQLEAVRNTLQALQGEQNPAIDLYDRLGRISRPQGNWSHHLA
jgi:flagellar biosynthesis/type III secretory pathway chaperone